MHTSHTTPNMTSFLASPPSSLCCCSLHHTGVEPPTSEERSLTFLRVGFSLQSRVIQREQRRADKRSEALRETTTADSSFHSCFTAVMNYFQAMVIHHKADNESTLTALFKSVYYEPSHWQLQLLHSLWKLRASSQICVQIANVCSERNHLESVTQGRS